LQEKAGAPPDSAASCVRQYREHIAHLLDCTHRILATVRFDKEHPQHLAAICLYATIFQSIGECYRLLDQPTVTVPGIMRGILESYADLCAVIQDPAYPKKMLATLHEEQRKHLVDLIKQPQNPFHAETATKIDAQGKLAEVTAALDKLRLAGHYPLTVYDRFKAAEMTDLYRTIYWRLCLDAHNNVAALETRHIRRTGANQFEIDVFAESSAHDLVTHYDALTGLLVDSSRRLYKLLEFFPPAEFNQQVEDFERFRPEAVNALAAQIT
jgi:hypothetical protein